MKKILSLAAAAAAILVLSGFSGKEKSSWGDYVVACGDKDLYIIDTRTSSQNSLDVLWHWNVDEAKGQIPDEDAHRARVLDDCKPVGGGKHILLTSSGNETLLLDIASKRVIFYAHTPMSHSADMLPGDRIAVANSTNPAGNSLEIYDVSKPGVVIWKDSLPGGHGVYWSEKHKCLYALGHKELRKYTLKGWNTRRPSLRLQKTYALPGAGGHDLTPLGEDSLLITNGGGVYAFEINSGTFSPFKPLEGRRNVKSVNHDPATGRTVYTVAETSWWTNHIYLLNPDKTLTFDPSYRLYKVRVLSDWEAVKSEMTPPPFPGFDANPSLRAPGTNLRIFDDNIWQNDSDKNLKAWEPLRISCTDSARSLGFAKMIADHKPDIVTLQEYSSHMDGYLAPKLRDLGFTNACEKDGIWNFTPVFYDSTAVELVKVKYNLYTPKTYSNANTKSFTSAVFRHKATGRVFAVLNTHLWWRPEKAQPGSQMARASQIRLMMAEADAIKAEYNCVIFLMGDMNCEEDTVPIRQLLDDGYIPCYKAATIFGDNNNGHHRCDAGGFSAESTRKGPDRATGALDHFFIHNAPKDVEVLVYYCIMDAYTLPLTDHYPNFADIKL